MGTTPRWLPRDQSPVQDGLCDTGQVIEVMSIVALLEKLSLISPDMLRAQNKGGKDTPTTAFEDIPAAVCGMLDSMSLKHLHCSGFGVCRAVANG